MEQLILRQAAIDAIEFGITYARAFNKETGEVKELFKESNDELRKAVERIKQLPPIQPEIVRCNDCKYAEYIDDVQTLWCTECGQGRTVAPNDFCSYAERREVTT